MTVGTSRQVPLDRSLQTPRTPRHRPLAATHPDAVAAGFLSSSNAWTHGRNERSGVPLDGEARLAATRPGESRGVERGHGGAAPSHRARRPHLGPHRRRSPAADP
jgi:hypothetical protein